ncbi:PD-(D/E)XK nuclease family protein [Acinetobacter sp. YH01009]|uniref:PDDEXK-like family protein n=2 Tax=unclassified Acinetobacter TaxID=196816 RepID=UPI0015D32CB8|nr:PD-(D/E)XK nuclease family protein [Acinetobacter sp. YH01009]
MEFQDIAKNSSENFLTHSVCLMETEIVSAKEQNCSKQLEAFFKAWQKISLDIPTPEKVISVDHLNLSRFFDAYKKALFLVLEAREAGLLLNVWKNSGLGSDEVRNSKVLKWFLDCSGDHGQGNKILLQFLKLLEAPFCDFQSEFYSTIEECCPLGNLESRVDIEIDALEFLLFIEIKIHANESFQQLERYRGIAKKKAAGRPWLVVYLTKDGNLPTDYLDNAEGLRGLSWGRMAKAFKKYVNSQNLNNRSLWLLSQFADHTKTF